MTEIWKDVVGFEGRYQVSNMGAIFSLPKVVRVGGNGGTTKRGGINLRQYQLPNGGHMRVYLADGSGKKVPLLVHRLVAMAFIQNQKDHPVINHVDGNPSNNRAENLEWCTVGYNNACCDRRRVKLQGARNGQSTLTEDTVLAIRSRFSECGNASMVAREFGVTARHAWSICHRKLWKHI